MDGRKVYEIEFELCEDTFQMWVAERFPDLPQTAKSLLLMAWGEAWLEGYQRGLAKGHNDTKRVAIQALKEEFSK